MSSKPVDLKISKQEVQILVEKTRDLSLKSPLKAAKILAEWINTSTQKNTLPKKPLKKIA